MYSHRTKSCHDMPSLLMRDRVLLSPCQLLLPITTVHRTPCGGSDCYLTQRMRKQLARVRRPQYTQDDESLRGRVASALHLS